MQHRRENLLEEIQKTVHALFLLRRHPDCGNIRVFHARLSLAWKSGVFAILFAVISGGFFTVYQAANQMLNRSCLERMPDEE